MVDLPTINRKIFEIIFSKSLDKYLKIWYNKDTKTGKETNTMDISLGAIITICVTIILVTLICRYVRPRKG